MRDSSSRERGWLFPLVMAIIVGLLGLWLTGFGAYLATLGGSLYYVLAGIGPDVPRQLQQRVSKPESR